MIIQKQIFYLTLLFLTIAYNPLMAQRSRSSDELFQEARSAAFQQKNYQVAVDLAKQGLQISPDYNDIRVFIGRVYTWWKKPDSARIYFEELLIGHPNYEDGISAYADLEYWNDNPAKSLLICEKGLKFHPQSSVLLFKKAKALIDLKRFAEANITLFDVLKNDPDNSEARSLLEKIKGQSAKNKIGISYDFVNFDKQFSDPWHIVSLDYSRNTNAGTFTGRVNYGNRFKTGALQFEADAYPTISKTFYAYLNAGFSNKNGVFPQVRSGASLFANLPQAFEAEAGLRYLYFSDPTWIYTASLGKYFKNYWFNLRTYLTPSNHSVSNSYALTARYYFKGTDYFSLGAGTGISPDERGNNIQLSNLYQLKSYRISAEFKNTFQRLNTVLLSFSWLQQEYLPKVNGNQYLFSARYERKF